MKEKCCAMLFICGLAYCQSNEGVVVVPLSVPYHKNGVNRVSIICVLFLCGEVLLVKSNEITLLNL